MRGIIREISRMRQVWRSSLTRARLPLPQSAGNFSWKPVAELSCQHAQLAAMMCLVSYEIGKEVDQIGGEVLPRSGRNVATASCTEADQLDHSVAATRECTQQLPRSYCTPINQPRNLNAVIHSDHLDPHAPGIVNVRDDHSHRSSW